MRIATVEAHLSEKKREEKTRKS